MRYKISRTVQVREIFYARMPVKRALVGEIGDREKQAVSFLEMTE